ncbi:hypothetical protein [Sulfurisphaera ohwakuensis]|uniref:ABC-type Fe3+/spermidine/putrescine transport system ATPase subunit n=1 Tax=Sulfurisphaera ohwakuensis TaxID=69656 RepID=A0A650CE32_SULOH|nr:hypothetical protein [Sulfurisphaera ohwakuensis]MBB5252948.1 ABC-type Fe3+/spermidine/putrescine transport system ATPase subunit [Sulfurisphaera ohwakuensis]QGR16123.1 hypothetical protein D1869_02150 [Sulfurisphaera ohwakuensis]
MDQIKIKLSSGREVILDDEAIRALNEYVRTQLTLEQLAKRLGLSGWEEAYELAKQVPAWVMWTPLPIYKKLKV